MVFLLPSVAIASPAPTFAGVPFDCGGDGLPIVGVPGLEIQCVHLPPADGSTWRAVRWTFGDGEFAEGEVVSHVYEATGQFSVILELDDWSPPPGEEDGSDPWWAAHGLVSVCGEPTPAFDIVARGGLEYEVVNHSSVTVHCLADMVWEVSRGEDAAPSFTFDTWEPRFTFPEEGAWNVSLTLEGVGGTAVAEQTVDATYGLPQLLRDQRSVCGTAPVAGVGWWVVAALALAARRRRE
jgi:hypothetical protein